ncbi:sugar kinase [Kribbella sandramycini]|uniref:Sugar kinase n=1 Tax=Kribbella sandramycini TaxID=60450 RepID=A0A7Y4L472_9ACTN|nr:sugar/nucleoside kinase (ribokinase family) [Kribbella sandramycini]NOL44079.1 sugar kinase [Kribbella sandramycini]
MTGRLVHTGQVVIDLVMQVPALPPVGGDVLAASTVEYVGGGFNVMAAAARAGAAVVYVGGHGTGVRGDRVRTELQAEGIALSQDTTADVDTGVCVVLVDNTGERTFVTGSGAETAVGAALPKLEADDIGYVSGYSLVVPEKAEQVLAIQGGALLVDPGPLVADIDPDVWARTLARTAVLSCNDREARLLTGTADPQAAAEELARRLPDNAVVVVRTGAEGCVVVQHGKVHVVPSVPVEVVDTNGAGDAHCGWFAAELLRGTDVLEAARRANVAAAIAVTRSGPATAPGRDEVTACGTAAPPAV